MKRAFSIAVALGSACLAGALLGALRTREVSLHLLAKNRSLDAVGVPPLPGVGHWETMASWKPAAAGALFYGLSLGLGAGTIAVLWVLASRSWSGALCRWGPWACLAAPAWALASGDLGLAAALAALCLAAISLLGDAPLGEPGVRLTRLLCCAVVALGFLPWARAPEGGFTRFRDRVLFASQAGLAVNRFYYRWTLYPAEALKPLAARSQPTATPAPGTSAEELRGFCAGARFLGALCLPPGSPGADVEFAVIRGESQLRLAGVAATWPPDPGRRREAWSRFSAETDSSRPLRRATARALWTGCPLLLLWALGSTCLWAAQRLSSHRLRRPGAVILAGAAAAWIAWAGGGAAPVLKSVASFEHLTARLSSEKPLERLTGVREARALGAKAAPVLLDALGDPVINVRYAAAEALGYTGGEGVVERLLSLLQSPEEWYVKERAFGALWRLGWRPPPP